MDENIQKIARANYIINKRESIVESQGLHQDGLNSLSYNGLKTPVINAHVYDIF